MNWNGLIIAPLACLLAGCTISVNTGPTRTERISVERDNAELVRASFNMSAGRLRIQGGASKLLEGDAVYNVEAWKPVVKYVSVAGHGTLTVDQPGHTAHAGKSDYEWNLRLPNDVPLDLAVQCGAGDASLKLGELRLRDVEVHLGAGRLDMDLRGAPERSYDVRVQGGVGEATVRLPHDVGIYAKANGGIGEIRTPGLKREGDHYINDAYNTSKASIRLEIEGGIGKINLIAD
jgi:hypothetical protein